MKKMSTQYYADCDSSGRLTLTPEAAANMKGFYEQNGFPMTPAFKNWLDDAANRGRAMDALPPDPDLDPDSYGDDSQSLDALYASMHGKNFYGEVPALKLADDFDPRSAADEAARQCEEFRNELSQANDSAETDEQFLEAVYRALHRKPLWLGSNQ